jgi:hypothetical protein
MWMPMTIGCELQVMKNPAGATATSDWRTTPSRHYGPENGRGKSIPVMMVMLLLLLVMMLMMMAVMMII